MRTRRWALILCSAVSFGLGCGGDDDDNGGKNSSNYSAAEVASGACKTMSSSSGAECKGVEEYSACVQDKCSTEYKMCLGAGWESGNFSGGKCETYFKCVTGSKDKCQNDCKLDDACMSCFLSTLTACTAGSGCTAPTCTTTGGGAGKGSAGSGTGGSSGGAGTSGVPNTGNKTCKDLQTCCNSLSSGDAKTACLQAYDAAKGSGDSVCSAIYTTLSAAGCK